MTLQRRRGGDFSQYENGWKCVVCKICIINGGRIEKHTTTPNCILVVSAAWFSQLTLSLAVLQLPPLIDGFMDIFKQSFRCVHGKPYLRYEPLFNNTCALEAYLHCEHEVIHSYPIVTSHTDWPGAGTDLHQVYLDGLAPEKPADRPWFLRFAAAGTSFWWPSWGMYEMGWWLRMVIYNGYINDSQ